MIPIFIPYVNRPDLLIRAVDSIPVSNEWQAEVINNSGKELPEGVFAGDCNPNTPLTFAATQNWMIHLAVNAWNAPFYLFMHSDAEAGEGTVQKLVEMADAIAKTGYRWGAIFTAYDALAAYSVDAMRDIGGWDLNLPWYLGDCDCYRRLRIAGYPTLESGLLVKHTPSQTLNSDPYIARRVAFDTPKWRSYYELKWGGPNEHEKFATPFNK